MHQITIASYFFKVLGGMIYMPPRRLGRANGITWRTCTIWINLSKLFTSTGKCRGNGMRRHFKVTLTKLKKKVATQFFEKTVGSLCVYYNYSTVLFTNINSNDTKQHLHLYNSNIVLKLIART